MDSLGVTFLDRDFSPRSDIIVGPQTIRSVAYGISLKLRRGWMAGKIANELYGIEPLNDLDGRICVTAAVASIQEINLSFTKELDLGYVRLSPTSSPVVDGNHVSVHGLVQGADPYRYAFVITTVTPNCNAVTFAAFFAETDALLFRGVVNELADSVQDLTN